MPNDSRRCFSSRAIRNGELPVIRLMAKAPETSTSVQELIGIDCRHNYSFNASDFCCCFFAGSSQRCCFLNVREVGI